MQILWLRNFTPKYVLDSNLNTYLPKYINYLEINQTEYVQEFYTENYKTFLREIKDLSKCRDIQNGRL